MFYLDITNIEVQAHNTSNDKTSKIYSCFVKFEDKTIPLGNLLPSQLSHTLFDAHLSIRDYTGESSEPAIIRLHPAIEKRLLRYLMLSRPSESLYESYIASILLMNLVLVEE